MSKQILIVLLMVAAIGGYLLFGKYLNNLNKPTTQTNSTQTATTSAETADWKTYTDPKGLFTFKYPGDANLSEIGEPNKTDCVRVEINNARIVFKTPQGAGGGCILTGVGSQTKVETITDSATVLGKTQEISGNLLDGKTEYLRIDNLPIKDFMIELGGTYDQGDKDSYLKDKSVMKQILSTFKFTDQNQAADISNWKTYNSLNNLYSLRYPSNWYQYGDKQALKDGSFAQYFSSKPDSKNRWKDLKDTDYAFAITISPMSATTYESGKTYLEMFPENEQIIGTKKTSDKENVELIGLSSIAGVKSIEIERTLKEGIISDVFYAREIILQKDPSIIRIATFAKNRENFQSKQKMTNQILSTFKFIP